MSNPFKEDEPVEVAAKAFKVMKSLDDTNKRNTIKEIIVDITTDHDSDTLEEVLDVYVDKIITLMLQERIDELDKVTQAPDYGKNDSSHFYDYMNNRTAALKEHSFKEKA